MGWLNQISLRWQAAMSTTYRWPAQDMMLPEQRYLHLVGGIHMGTSEMSPLPARLLKKLHQSDALIVEADITRDDAPFDNLATYPPLAERLNAEQLARLVARTAELGVSITLFDRQPLWQIAMILQATQAQTLELRPDYGIDYQLLIAAHQHNIPVIELEGTDSQLTLLHALPDNGLTLLLDTLTHWHTNARLLEMMIGWWRGWQPDDDKLPLPSTFSQPLHDMLMQQRHLAWCQKLLSLPSGRYIVAVGASHLYGEGNLPEMIKERQLTGTL